MKHTLLSSLIGASLAVTCVMADESMPQDQPVLTVDQSSLIEKVSYDVKASPDKAAEIVKAAIADSKADAHFVAQIVQSAILAAPEKAEDICIAAIAVAPDAEEVILQMLAGISEGDEVAASRKVLAAQNRSELKKLHSFLKSIKPFQNTTDVSVDDSNKDNKRLVSYEVLRLLLNQDNPLGRQLEVKLDDFSYLLNISNQPDNGRYQVIILKKDTSLSP